MTSAPAAALELRHIGKRYRDVTALDDATLVVRPGTVHAVLGENGAGKTTLMRVAYGMVRPDTGTMHVAGRVVRPASPLDAIAEGIGMVHQHFTLVPAMTVAENLVLGGRGRLRPREMASRVRDVAEKTGFLLDPDARIEALPVSAQQRVEIAKALVRDASVLILDEPTAVLAPAETEDLLHWLRSYVAAGSAAVLITHKLREALSVADDITVLRQGRVVFSGPASGMSAERITDAMLGSASGVEAPTSVTTMPFAPAAVVFHAERMRVVGQDGRIRVRDVSFDVRAGEIVGVAAIEGSGQRELLRALAGRAVLAAGTLMRPDVVGFVPEDRHRDGVLLDRSLAENVALRGAGIRNGVVDWARVHAGTDSLVSDYDVRAGGSDMPMRSLSGGNQQKLVLARELEPTFDQPQPPALVVENPTRGLDVRATAAVHERLREACRRGAAVVVYSSDLDEVLSLATRVLVMFDGAACEPPLDRAAIGSAMLGL